MVQPPGFNSSTHLKVVCRLKKPLYGLKQAPCCREDCGCVSQPPRFCDSAMIGVKTCNRKRCDDKKPIRQDKCDVVAKRILLVKQPLTIFICQKLLVKTRTHELCLRRSVSNRPLQSPWFLFICLSLSLSLYKY